MTTTPPSKLLPTLLAFACLALPSILFGSEGQPFPDQVPAVCEIVYEHDMGAAAEVKGDSRRLIYRDLTRQGLPVFIHPTTEQWAAFVRAINAAKVYEWSDHYSGRIFGGGTDSDFRWSVRLQFGDLNFQSDGKTAFPLDGDLTEKQREGSSHRSYDLFMQAVARLIGEDFPY